MTALSGLVPDWKFLYKLTEHPPFYKLSHDEKSVKQNQWKKNKTKQNNDQYFLYSNLSPPSPSPQIYYRVYLNKPSQSYAK